MKEAVVRAGSETVDFSGAETLVRLSELMDSALAPHDSTPTIDRLLTDPAMRDAWDEYHLVGDALRSDDLSATFVPERAAAQAFAFACLLDAEPTVLAPHAQPLRRQNWLRYGLPGASAAAAVAMVAWIGLPQFSGDGQQVVVERAAPAAIVVETARPAVDPRQLQEYLSAHRQYSTGVLQAVDFSGAASGSAVYGSAPVIGESQ